MDLLVELIVWIFKSILGGEEKPKQRGQGGKPAGPAVRGPYDYGDSRQTPPNMSGGMQSGGAKPKTLEEILEEVRRQQQQRQTAKQQPEQQVQRTNVQQNNPQRQIEPIKLSKAQRRALKEAARQAKAARDPEAHAPHQATVDRHLESSFERREHAAEKEGREIQRQKQIERNSDEVKTREDVRFRPLSEEQVEVEAVNSVAADARVAREGRKVDEDFFKSLRSGKPEVRREMARRAWVLYEVFGPPKARQRRGPKSRVG